MVGGRAVEWSIKQIVANAHESNGNNNVEEFYSEII